MTLVFVFIIYIIFLICNCFCPFFFIIILIWLKLKWNGQWYHHYHHLLTLFAIFYEGNTEGTNFRIMFKYIHYYAHVLFCIQFIWDLNMWKALRWPCAVDGAIVISIQGSPFFMTLTSKVWTHPGFGILKGIFTFFNKF